jgi:tetratricopeptide (TPR) repeat protein
MSSRPSEPGDKARWYDDVDWRLIGIGLAVTILVMIGVDILIVFGWPPRLNRTITESQLALSPEALTASTAPTATLAEMTPLSTQASQAGGALSPTFTQTSQAEPDQGLTATPTQPNAALQEQLAEANALYEAFQFDAAIEQFTDVLAQEPENVEALVGRAHAYQAGYYWHESEIDYETALALDPDYAEAYYGLISLYLLRRNYGAAFQLLERAEEKCADDPYFYVVAGSVYFNMGDYETSYDYDNEALQRGEETATVYSGRGAALSWLGRDEEALADYNRAITLDPNFYQAYLNRANLLRRYGKLDEALADLQRAIDADPENPAVRCQIGQFYLKEEDPEAAIAAFSEGVALHERAFSCRLGRASVLSDQRRFEEGLADIQYVIDHQPDFTVAYDDLGNLYIDWEDWQGAVDAFTVIIESNPYPLAYENRGYAYLRMGDYEAALDDLDWAISLYPYSGMFYYDRAVTLLHLGELQAALSDVEQVLNIDPSYVLTATTDELGNVDTDPFHSLIQGIYWERQNTPGEAAAAYRAFLDAYGRDDEIARYARERLEAIQ